MGLRENWDWFRLGILKGKKMGEVFQRAYANLVGFFGVEGTFGEEEGRADESDDCCWQSNALDMISIEAR